MKSHPSTASVATTGMEKARVLPDPVCARPSGLRSIVGESGRGFDGYGIGGALEKQNLGTIVRWVNEELPEHKPRHMLGISEPDDFFAAIEPIVTHAKPLTRPLCQ